MIVFRDEDFMKTSKVKRDHKDKVLIRWDHKKRQESSVSPRVYAPGKGHVRSSTREAVCKSEGRPSPEARL